MTEETGLSAEEFATWIKPAAALKMLPASERSTFQESLGQRLVLGLLRAAAETVMLHRQEPMRHALVPSEVWHGWACEYDDRLWAVGDTIIPVELPSGGVTSGGNRLFDVRFDPEGLKRIGAVDQKDTAPVLAPSSGTPVRSHAGGRPPKAYWEPLLIEICRQLYVGDLKPDRQADIEKAMHDWLMANDHLAGETQVRERARALFNALKG